MNVLWEVQGLWSEAVIAVPWFREALLQSPNSGRLGFQCSHITGWVPCFYAFLHYTQLLLKIIPKYLPLVFSVCRWILFCEICKKKYVRISIIWILILRHYAYISMSKLSFRCYFYLGIVSFLSRDCWNSAACHWKIEPLHLNSIVAKRRMFEK